ncbi:MAG: hypothetical protein ACR2G6_15960 [Gemmatimonadaceae bacterium]
MSEKDSRVATARRERTVPTMEQVKHCAGIAIAGVRLLRRVWRSGARLESHKNAVTLDELHRGWKKLALLAGSTRGDDEGI